MLRSSGPDTLTLPFSAIGPADLPIVGGKGANLGALASAGFPVPPGFCVTTAAYRRFLAQSGDLEPYFGALDALDGQDVEAARRAATEMRAALGALPLPAEVEERVLIALSASGADHPHAVRSSATAEDLPGASFAGQQDTYLNMLGEAAVLDAVRRCWISLFTDRAVLYRARNGFGHRAVSLSVVVQRMVAPEASGILFTADPVSGDRGIVSIDAGFGLGEALVSGLVSADLYKVHRRTGELHTLTVGDKAIAIWPRPEGGTWEERLSDERRRARVLDDAQVRELTRLGVAIEAHYGGKPQDVEWCLEGGKLYVVQARPITSLFPLPPPPDDGQAHVYLHFGHVQMMTDPMSPMGRDLWRIIIPFGRGPESLLSPALTEAGSRLFIDPTPLLRITPARRRFLPVLRHIYSPAAELLERWAERPELRSQERAHPEGATIRGALPFALRIAAGLVATFLWMPTEGKVQRFERRFDGVVERARERILAAPAGVARLDACVEVVGRMLPTLVPAIAPQVASGIVSLRRLEGWLAGRAAPEDLAALGRGLEGNVTTEMDQQVADLADLARGRPDLVALLRSRTPAQALVEAPQVEGGAAFVAAFRTFLQRWGMRGAAEIDIARPRWRDDPSLVMAAVLGNLAAAGEPGAHRARHRRQGEEASAAITRLQGAVSGGLSRWLVGRLARVARSGLALREHPKFTLIRVLDTVRATLLELGASLVAAGRLARAEDVFQLHLAELRAALQSHQDLRPLVADRLATLKLDAQKSPPLAMTSSGEILTVPLPADLPPGALSGVAASAGVVEGVARVVLDPAREVLHAGEILVAPFTDPGWTPLFVHAAGLITEVGGLMTHGSVVAREYGIPAVVSVAGATTTIRSGDRLRVDGTRGLVERL